ncbi:MAG TPA: tRNA-(guanine-N1)-methyltransferase [Elusimicrobia bacterium]|nr:MAG: tRNA-(guanine-N1)-methyltransferase [Elusimicrobia bacterium GWF2_62_30]HBA60829.1 tRNA-(guanine-N1)-methyltransferase [Elusimicrobiota bacterium]
MAEFIEAAALAQLRDPGLAPTFPKGLPVLLIKKNGALFALENRCPHLGCPLTLGSLDGDVLTCPCHDWRFDIRSGRFLDAPELGLKIYRTRIAEGKIFVEV